MGIFPLPIIPKGDYMRIYYFSGREYIYASRKRKLNIDLNQAFHNEENNSVRLGDGATTTIKTSVANLADYVVIDDGYALYRWFVMNYVYLNGSQVEMQLQRDVVGSFGLSSLYGKVERGVTDNVLKYRKELSVNQILKDRKKIIPQTNEYGNYSIDDTTKENQLWGVLYFTKPTGINPETGQPYPEEVNVQIPAFVPKTYDLPRITNNDILLWNEPTKTIYIALPIEHRITQITGDVVKRYRCIIDIYNNKVDISLVDYVFDLNYVIITEGPSSGLSNTVKDFCTRVKNVFNRYLTKPIEEEGKIIVTQTQKYNIINTDYSNKTVKSGNNYYSYSKNSLQSFYNRTGTFNFDNFKEVVRTTGAVGISVNVSKLNDVECVNLYQYIGNSFSERQLTDSEAGTITLNSRSTVVEEPYNILVMPLFDTVIARDEKRYDIQKNEAFMVFNTIIESLSGENPYLIDAQIYPYCPALNSVISSINNFPLFSIFSNTYEYDIELDYIPNGDVKKEYIENLCAIVSPDQNGKYEFNYYDYKTVGDWRSDKLKVTIKTALKPFAIISSCIVKPESNCLYGMTYGSDLRGCTSSSNGFECSLSSNAFQTYARQNANYQQIFDLQQEELRKQHQVEKVNEVTGAITNTITAGVFGAIGGMSATANPLGALAGIGTAAVVGTAGTIQSIQNEGLRKYEEYMQKQMYDLNIGTIKSIPNSLNRVSSFNEITLKDFWYILEVYSCSEAEKEIIDRFVEQYAYGIGVYDFFENYNREETFIRGVLIKSNLPTLLHNIARDELAGGVYIYE